MAVEGGQLVVKPHPRPRYTVSELLAQCDAKAARGEDAREWVRGKAAGDELISLKRGDIGPIELDPTEGHTGIRRMMGQLAEVPSELAAWTLRLRQVFRMSLFDWVLSFL